MTLPEKDTYQIVTKPHIFKKKKICFNDTDKLKEMFFRTIEKDNK